ncbi:MAG: endonuclease domain-containing protein [Polyangiaceae bacterium]
MRSAPTTSEALLWQGLRGSRLGVAFRRQVVIGEYIADFVAPSIRLVVEVDGEYHADRVRADERRDRALTWMGYSVVRIPAALVLKSAALLLVVQALP